MFHPNPSETLLGMLVFKLQVGNLSKSLKFKLMTWMRGQGMSAAIGRHSKRDVLLFGRWQGPLRNSKNVLLNSARPEWKSVTKRERWMLSWVFVRFCDESVADVDAQRARCRPVVTVLKQGLP